MQHHGSVNRKLNLLFVTQNYAYPAVRHGGGQDFWQLFEALGSRHNLYVATFDDPIHAVSAQALAPYVSKVCVIPYSRSIWQKLWRTSRAVLRGYHDLRIPRRHWEMCLIVRSWCERYAIDVLYCAWTEMGQHLLAPCCTAVRVLDLVELRYLADEYAVKHGQLSAKAAAQHKADELKYSDAADLVITRAKADLDDLKLQLPDLNGFVLPPVGNVKNLISIRLDEAQPNEIMFCGAMNREANITGVRWFIEKVWPQIQQKIPAAKLMIVGAFPPVEILNYASLPGVSVTGAVPDLRPYYARARLVIAPIFVAGGSLNKVMDGLAAGRPVVATSVANRGTNAPCVKCADTVQDFTDAVVSLLKDHELWLGQAIASRTHALTHFNWSAEVGALEARLMTLVAQKHRSRKMNFSV
jgi:glycosyltransferase involved in cell wall biosynthesis